MEVKRPLGGRGEEGDCRRRRKERAEGGGRCWGSVVS